LDITFDFTGASINIGGTGYTQWSTFFWMERCEYEIIGGEFDYLVQPYFQGAITTIGADYIDITLESGATAPGFTTGYSIQGYDSNRFPNYSAFSRSPYTGTAFDIEDRGSNVYRIKTLTAGEVGSYYFATVWPVGSLVSVWGQKDGCEWFRSFLCNKNHFTKCQVNVAVDSFAYIILGKNLKITNCTAEPRDKQKGVGCVNRGFINTFNSGGETVITGNYVRYNLDDPFPIHGASFGQYKSGATDYPMVYQSATTFDAFLDSHFFSYAVPAGSKIIVYEDDGIERARCTIVSSVAGTGYYRRYTVTVESGSLPNPMTDCIAVILDYTPRGTISNNFIEATRGRPIFSSIRGTITGNYIRSCSDEGILIEPSRSNWQYQWHTVNKLSITGNTIENANNNYTTYYPAAIVVRAANMDGTTIDLQSIPNAATSAVTPFNAVSINGNTITNTKNMGIYVGGIDGIKISNNFFYTVASSGAGAAGEPWEDLTACIIGYQNCKNGMIIDNFATNANSATFVKGSYTGAFTQANLTVYTRDNIIQEF
jgi:hypothetical protein